jgi:cyclohexa-1,5-dienecarbonyl-CoA hydratase
MSTAVERKFSRLALEVESSLARIALRNGTLNIIDIAMMEELTQALAEVESRADVAVILLYGEGKSFSAGVDVAAHTPDKVEAMLSKFHAVIRVLVGSKKVTIAAVDGNCLGGGAELAMMCDIVYTTATARWGFPEIKLGCYPPVACTALSALVGQKRAAELILTGRNISGTEAVAMGLANHTIADGGLHSAAEQAAAELAKLSPAALAVTKKALYAWDAMHFEKGLARAEKIYMEELMKTADAQEGIQAFLQKRQPKWAGK